MIDIEDKLTIDKQTLKVLSSDTRIEILKNLKMRRMHLSEIADKLHIKPATAKEHMIHLLSSGLVDLKDEGRKWKYYELTKKGQYVVSPIEIRMVLVLSITFLGMILTVKNFINKLQPPQVLASRALESKSTDLIAPSIDTQEFLLALLMVFAFGVAIGYAMSRYKTRKIIFE